MALFVFASTVPAAAGSRAEGDPGPEHAGPNTLATVLLVEGAIVVDSVVAMAAPEVFGSLGLLLTPLAARGKSTAEDAAAMSLWAGLCIYNIVAPSSLDLSDREVFAHNAVGWHVVAAGLFLVGALVDDTRPKDEGIAFGMAPTATGWQAGFVGRF